VLNLIEDFGGKGPVLHFAHANAYPIKSYSYFLNLFTDSFTVIGMNQRPMWPEESEEDFNDWSILADDLILELDGYGSGPVFGLGHSMGAIATLLASHKRPDLFKKIVLVEPVILPEQVYGYMAKMSFEERKAMNPMIAIAAKRRNSWTERATARENFESKSFFQRFSSHSKEDYLDYGLSATQDGGFKLAYRREWEARIYGTTINPWSYLEKTKVPCLIIRAQHSDVMRSDAEWQAVKNRAVQSTCVQFDKAGHMVPMEQPQALHKLIEDYLNEV